MTDDLHKRAEEIVSAMTPGPLTAQISKQPKADILKAIGEMIDKGGEGWHWVEGTLVHPGDTRAVTIAETGNGPTSMANARGIAFLRNMAPHWLAVVRAARRVEQEHHQLHLREALRDALAAYEAALAKELGDDRRPRLDVGEVEGD